MTSEKHLRARIETLEAALRAAPPTTVVHDISRELALDGALLEAYWIVHHAWDTDRFGCTQRDEVKEMRREMAAVLGRVGIPSPRSGEVYTGHDLPGFETLQAENRRLQDLLDRQERDLVALKEHIGTWKRETLAKLREELLLSSVGSGTLRDTRGNHSAFRAFLAIPTSDLDRILPADETPESGR